MVADLRQELREKCGVINYLENQLRQEQKKRWKENSSQTNPDTVEEGSQNTSTQSTNPNLINTASTNSIISSEENTNLGNTSNQMQSGALSKETLFDQVRSCETFRWGIIPDPEKKEDVIAIRKPQHLSGMTIPHWPMSTCVLFKKNMEAVPPPIGLLESLFQPSLSQVYALAKWYERLGLPHPKTFREAHQHGELGIVIWRLKQIEENGRKYIPEFESLSADTKICWEEKERETPKRLKTEKKEEKG